MGVFRDFFNNLYNDYLKTPINDLKDKFDDFNDWLNNYIKQPLDNLFDQLGKIDNQIDTKISDLMGEIKKLPTGFESYFNKYISNPINKFTDEASTYFYNKTLDLMIWRLKDSATVSSLNKALATVPEPFKSDTQLQSFYKDEKKKLEKQGLESTEDIVTVWIGTQLANAVFAVTNKAIPYVTDWLTDVQDAYKIRSEEIERMKALASKGEFGLAAVTSFMLGITIYPAIQAYTAPIWDNKRQEAYMETPAGLLDPALLISAKWRGFDKTGIFEDTMARFGYSDEEITLYENTMKFHPPPSDLISMMGREAFEPDVIKNFNLDAQFENIDLSYLEAAGVTEEWAKKLWVAHWAHPGWYRIREGINRGFIPEEDLDHWMMLQDIAPYWSDMYHSLLHRTLTRVDTRRMHDLGVLDEKGVLQTYKAIGYSDEDAENMTLFTKKYNASHERQLTRSQIEDLYKKGEIKRAAAVTMLTDIEYPKDQAELVISLIDSELKENEIDNQLNVAVTQYVSGAITKDKLYTKVSDFGFSESRMRKIMLDAENDKERSLNLPTKKDIVGWYQGGKIKEDKAREYLNRINIPEEFIDLYLK